MELRPETVPVNLTVQWHITALCNKRCKHCYVFDEETYQDEIENELSLNELEQVLDSIEDFEQKWDAKIEYFAISGGDPTMRKDWKDFIRMLRGRGRKVSIMLNPESVTDDVTAFLKEMDVMGVQFSLDGLRETHDYFREEGNFDLAVQKCTELKNAGLRPTIMFTLFPSNADQLVPLMNYLAKESDAVSLTFEMGTAVGNGKDLDCNFKPEEVKKVLNDYLKEKEKLAAEGYDIAIGEKSNLMKLSNIDVHGIHPFTTSCFGSTGGCLVGWMCLPILSDGTVLACRRLPLRVGRMPEQSFEDIVLGNELLKKFRRHEFYKDCGDCTYYHSCRGCPAYVYSETGDPFARYSLCFKDLVEEADKQSKIFPESPPLTTTKEEEFALLQSRFSFNAPYVLDQLKKNHELGKLFLKLWNNREEQRKYLANPQAYAGQEGYELHEYELFYLKKVYTVQYGKLAQEGYKFTEAEMKLYDLVARHHAFGSPYA